MSKAMENMIIEAVTEKKQEIAITMIKDGVLELEKIATYVGVTIEEVKKLAEKELQ